MVKGKCLRLMKKAIFLDRDGIINRERDDYTYRLEDFEILPDVIEILLYFQKKNYLLIIISNQSGVAKNIYSQGDVEILHSYLLTIFEKNLIHLTEIYYCTHHPEKGKCLCRKPNSLMVEKAVARFNIDASKSYFIGDKQRDIDAGEKAGVKGLFIESNHSLKEVLSIVI